MKKFLLLTLFLSTLFSSSAQITFQKTYGGLLGESIRGIDQTTDGGYILTGGTNSFGAGANDIVLIRTNWSGNMLWANTYGGIMTESAYSVKQTTDGGFILTGSTNSYGAGLNDAFLLKVDSGGSLQWMKTYGGSNYDDAFSVSQTDDGGYIVCGRTQSFGAGLFDAYLIKTNSSGDTLWTKTYGGSNFELGNSVIQTIDGGYIVAGNTGSFGTGLDVFLIKTDGSGSPIWEEGIGASLDDQALSVEQTSDSGYIVAGHTLRIINGDTDGYLVKTDGSGNVAWSKTFLGTTNNEDLFSVHQTSDGGYVMAGLYNQSASTSDFYLIKTNAIGDTLWSRVLGGSDFDIAYSVQQTNDSGYVVGGYTKNFGAGIQDMYFVKTDYSGFIGCNTIPASTTILSPFTVVITGGTTSNPASDVSTVTPSVNSVAMQPLTLCSTAVVGSEIKNLESEIFLSPNPAYITFTISTATQLKNAQLEIYNLLGEKKYSVVFANIEQAINIETFPAGIYFVKVQSEKGSVVQKLIVQ